MNPIALILGAQRNAPVITAMVGHDEMNTKAGSTWTHSPLFMAAGEAKQLIEAADLGVYQRVITREAGRIANGDPVQYLDYVRDRIDFYEAQRARKESNRANR